MSGRLDWALNGRCSRGGGGEGGGRRGGGANGSDWVVTM